MCPKPRAQGGFAIVSAIFIIVTLAILGVFMLRLSTTQHVGSALDSMGARAYQAARAGTEWGMFHAIRNSTDAATAPRCTAGTNTTSFVLDGFTVTVTCTAVASGDAAEAGLGHLFSITSTACNLPASGACPGAAGQLNYVERRVSVMTEF